MVIERWSDPIGVVWVDHVNVVREVLKGKVHTEFGFLQGGNQHLASLKDILQFCAAVVNAIAIELHVRSCSLQRQVLMRWCSSWQEGELRWRVTAGRGSLLTKESSE